MYVCCHKYQVDCFGSLPVILLLLLKWKSRNITKHFMSGPLGNQKITVSLTIWHKVYIILYPKTKENKILNKDKIEPQQLTNNNNNTMSCVTQWTVQHNNLVVTYNSHFNLALPYMSRNSSQLTAKYSFISSSYIEDNKSDMSTDPGYIDSGGKGLRYRDQWCWWCYCSYTGTIEL